MDKSHQLNFKSIKKIRPKFHKSCITIFKNWNSFREALDNNPQILTYFNEDHSVLEINEYLDVLYDEILSILNNTSNNQTPFNTLTNNNNVTNTNNIFSTINTSILNNNNYGSKQFSTRKEQIRRGSE